MKSKTGLTCLHYAAQAGKASTCQLFSLRPLTPRPLLAPPLSSPSSARLLMLVAASDQRGGWHQRYHVTGEELSSSSRRAQQEGKGRPSPPPAWRRMVYGKCGGPDADGHGEEAQGEEGQVRVTRSERLEQDAAIVEEMRKVSSELPGAQV
eukprot:666455-Hanusia_phi.AAC.2